MLIEVADGSMQDIIVYIDTMVEEGVRFLDDWEYADPNFEPTDEDNDMVDNALAEYGDRHGW